MNEINIRTQCKSSIDEVESESSVRVPESPSTLLKLDVDCFEELFEWLSLADLLALRQTCKHLQKVVDYFIKTNYPSVKIGYGKIKIIGNDLNEFQTYDAISLKMIKEINFFTSPLTKKEIDILKVILPEIEKCSITFYKIFEGDFYELFLKYCSNLKHLRIASIYGSNNVIGNDNSWLLREYPSLEHFEYENVSKGFNGQIEELKTFFELNPNIQVFSTTNTFLCGNAAYFLESNIKIDRLDINFHRIDGVDEMCELLDKLFDQGFYKHVHLYIRININVQRVMDQIGSIRGMEKLYLFIALSTTPPPMPSLRELAMDHCGNKTFKDWDQMARNLTNLERIYIKYADSNSITTFLRHVPRLKEIKIGMINANTHFENSIIDLDVFNKQRSKLTGATKVTIYVGESIFLATKRAITNIDLSLVSLKRAQAVKWIHQFSLDPDCPNSFLFGAKI